MRVGQGSAASIPGGPMESVRFMLEHAARRGRPLQAGQLISTGAATGIHNIAVGQVGRVSFGRYGAVGCRAIAATAERRAEVMTAAAAAGAPLTLCVGRFRW